MIRRMGLRMLPLLIALSTTNALAQPGLVNFSHLRHLTETISLAGDSVDIVHVYANYPSYDWVSAAESGPEGIACVDDAARAGVVYLRHYELYRDGESRSRAIALLKFIMNMETPDGMFYNFILAGHDINTSGKTSFASFGWWASRGVWAMSAGLRILKSPDSALAAGLRERITRTFPHIDSLFSGYKNFDTIAGYRVPRWLLYGSGADASSELLLGLTDYYAATHDTTAKTYIRKIAEGLMAMQDGIARAFPWGLHRSWQTTWHMWGNGQTQALSYAGKILDDKGMIRSAEREARGFYPRLLIEGFRKEMDVADKSKISAYDQIAYGVRPLAVGLVRLYEATGKDEYLAMAGLAGSWFFGNNVLRLAMYDSTTGRCFDGIRDSISVNRNSGAESTVEALFTMTELGKYPKALKVLAYRKVMRSRSGDWLYAVFQNETRDELTLALDVKRGFLQLLEGDASRNFRSKMQSQ